MAAVNSVASPPSARNQEDRFHEFQHHIQEMLDEGHTNPEIVAALKRLGFKTSTRSLQRFLKSSGLRRPSGTAGVRTGVSDELAEAINYLFHHTTLNDTQLAARCLTDYQLQTTARQVKSIRLMFGWLRRLKGAASDA